MSENLFSRILQLIGLCLNRAIYKRCDYVIVHNHYFKEYIWKIYLECQMEKGKILVIPHIVDTNEFVPLVKNEAVDYLRKYLDNHLIQQILTKVIIGYSGLLSNTIGSDILTKIFQLFENDDRFIFLIVGEGSLKQKLIDFVRQHKIRNVWFIGPFSYKLMKYVINLFDIAIITSYHRKMIAPSIYWFPKKLVEYAACGKPILFIGISKIIKNYLNRYRAGICIQPEMIERVKSAVTSHIIPSSYYTTFSQNSRKLAEEFSLSKAMRKLRRLLQTIEKYDLSVDVRV